MIGKRVVLFAGYGGASLGIRDALGRDPDYAINHDPIAIAVHAANHPNTNHLRGNVWHYDPRTVVGSSPVDFLWASPTCTFFSQAKGGPLDWAEATRVRALAWVVTRWAKDVRPRVIIVENVPAFARWGPLLNDGTPCPLRRGQTFRKWIRAFEKLGYTVDWRELVASDYGAPTSRKRLFIVARCDGLPIEWPTPTHGLEPLFPKRSAYEVIDWSIPAPSIFGRKRGLVEATCRRIARGIRRFVLETAEPWIISNYGTSTGKSIRDPLPAVTAGSRHEALAVPYIIPTSHSGDARVHGIEEPLRTITASSRSPFQLVVPSLIHVSNGERPGQTPRVYDISKPFSTFVAGGIKHGLVTAHLMKNFGGHEGPGQSMLSPLGAITTKDHHALVICSTIGDKRDEVRTFMRLYGDGFESTSIRVNGETYDLADIGMRLLVPRELGRGHDFGDDLALETDVHGHRVTKTSQVRLVGNSVPRKLAEAVARMGSSTAAQAA